MVTDKDFAFMPNYSIKDNELYFSDGTKIKGVWKIDANCDLVYFLKKDEDKIYLKGTIIEAGPDNLVFSLESRVSDKKSRIDLIKLIGIWKKDKKNNIVFEVKKKNAENDILEFKSRWRISKHHQLQYVYKKKNLKRRTKREQAFTLKGIWQITGKDRLRYILTGKDDAYIDFDAYLESNNVYPKRKILKYRIGLGSYESSKGKRLVLSGLWRISNILDMEFKTTYKKHKDYANRFKIKYKFLNKDSIQVVLYTLDENPTGIKLIYTKSMFKDAEGFIRFKKMVGEVGVEVGVTLQF